MGSKDDGDNISDHSCNSHCSCNWDWNNLTFSQQEQIDEIYKAGDDYYAAHPDTPLNLSQPPTQTEIGTTSNPQPIAPEPPQSSTPIPQAPRIDYKSKQWKDCKMFITSGDADDVAYCYPKPMIMKCNFLDYFKANTLKGISKYAFKEYDDFVGINPIQVDYAKGWIVSIRESEIFGKRIIVIDDGTRQVDCHLRLDQDRYPLIRKPVEVGCVIVLYKICCQFAPLTRGAFDYDNFTFHGGYSNILAVF